MRVCVCVTRTYDLYRRIGRCKRGSLVDDLHVLVCKHALNSNQTMLTLPPLRRRELSRVVAKAGLHVLDPLSNPINISGLV